MIGSRRTSGVSRSYFWDMRRLLLVLAICAVAGRVQAAGPHVVVDPTLALIEELPEPPPIQPPSRATAAGLAVLLGPFGAHRLYLGTGVKVPIVYGITFGAFGILPLIDLVHILVSKDLTAYCTNERVLMWAREQP